MSLQGKSFLITQNDIFSINGSSVIVLELAEYLLAAGANVSIYTYFLNEPLRSEFAKRRISVVDDDNTTYHINDFDYIWVHQQVLPLSVIKDLNSDKLVVKPKFIFNHMSSLDNIAEEFSYIWDLENRLSSVSLFNSMETMNKQISSISKEIELKLFPNPAPNEFSHIDYTANVKVKKILIVSNHPPEELNQAKTIFRRQNIEVDSLGELQGRYQLISPDILSGYDVVITIGKTVQYCLVAGIPTYVYDHFGGSGYLNNGNYALNAHNNFSGRGFEKKHADKIVKEVTDEYSNAVAYQSAERKNFIYHYSLDGVVGRVLATADKSQRTYLKFDKRYCRYLVDSHNHNHSREHRIAAKLRNIANERVQALEKELQNIKNSRSYKIGNIIAKPIRMIKDGVK